jgi:hypothetical protein
VGLLLGLGCAEAPTSPVLSGTFALVAIGEQPPPYRFWDTDIVVYAETLVVRSRTDVTRTWVRESPATEPGSAPRRVTSTDRMQFYRWRHLDFLGCYTLDVPANTEIDCDGGERIVQVGGVFYVGEPPAVRRFERVAP